METSCLLQRCLQLLQMGLIPTPCLCCCWFVRWCLGALLHVPTSVGFGVRCGRCVPLLGTGCICGICVRRCTQGFRSHAVVVGCLGVLDSHIRFANVFGTVVAGSPRTISHSWSLVVSPVDDDECDDDECEPDGCAYQHSDHGGSYASVSRGSTLPFIVSSCCDSSAIWCRRSRISNAAPAMSSNRLMRSVVGNSCDGATYNHCSSCFSRSVGVVCSMYHTQPEQVHSVSCGP